jgi:hypothetical protein
VVELEEVVLKVYTIHLLNQEFIHFNNLCSY